MGKTISEKILSLHSGKDVKADDFIITNVDIALVQDGTGPLTIKEFHNLKFNTLIPHHSLLFIDHASPSPRKELSNAHNILRSFANGVNAKLFDVGEGVSHQIVAEKFVKPGNLVVGADSHTCTAGAMGAFATGMGSTDIAIAFGTGKVWLKVPQTIKIKLTGQIQKGVYSKDVMLHIIGDIKADGATYKALEFDGDYIHNLSFEQRLTLTNMAVEAGAKTGIIPTDDITKEYLKKHNREKDYIEIYADNDAIYEQILEYDVSKIEPQICFPHTVDNVKNISEINEDIKIDQVVIGTCKNGRLEDLKISADIMKGHKKHKNIRCLIVPASKEVYKEAVKEGFIDIFIDFGATIINPGCGPCVGVHAGILADGEKVLSTQNRNFKGRMGNPLAEIYLSSPATAAATAITGKITDPRNFI